MKPKPSLPATWLVGRKTRLRPLEATDVPKLSRYGLRIDRNAVGFIVQTHDGVDIGALGLVVQGPQASVAIAFQRREHFEDGSASDALRVIRDGVRRSQPIERIEALVDATERAALRAFQRAGFQREGRLRQALRVRSQFHDAVVMSAIGDG